MLTRIATEPAALIHDFHRDCDLPEDSDSSLAMDTGLLAADLQLLNESRLEQHQCRHWPPTLLLHGRNDRIVAPQRAEELAALAATSKLTVIDDAGHGLPFTHPRLCLNLIVDFYHHIVHSGDNFL
jgi:pimeloyl-[acyl-carrier protein] methyl ester esterase